MEPEFDIWSGKLERHLSDFKNSVSELERSIEVAKATKNVTSYGCVESDITNAQYYLGVFCGEFMRAFEEELKSQSVVKE